MKKLFALSCALLSLVALVPLVGCGGSGSSDYYPQGASVVDSGGTRGIRVSWTQPNTDPRYTIVEYQIVRTSPSDAVPTELVVGIAGPNAVTFVDTIQTRVVTYNNIPNSDSILSPGASTLIPRTVTVPGLTPDNYAYSVRALVHFNNLPQYNTFNALDTTAPVAFQ